MRARRGAVLRLRHPEAILTQIAAEKIADARVVVDHEKVRGVIGQIDDFAVSGIVMAVMLPMLSLHF